ncbi:MAG TPA: hypothetical protein VJY35_08940 [Candidatus Eisenbacteria bacterium]|nr:hypothetical protein [Candidatus Eisenbacteria bacterium]
MSARIVKCQGCGADIFFAITPNGARMPLDAKPVPGLYNLLQPDASGQDRCAFAGKGYTSHFTTCPKARDFSGRNAAKGGA